MATKICPKCNTENPVAASFCRQCGYQFSEESKNGAVLEPVIKDFQVMDDCYTIGSSITLMWEIVNATEILIDGVNVTNHESYEYDVKGDVALEIIAKNEFLTRNKKIKISPQPLPKIKKFGTSRHKIKEGEKVKLMWDVKHAEKILLQSNMSPEQNLACKKTLEVKPKMGEIYTLVCYSKDPKVYVTKDLEINVLGDVRIEFFVPDKNSIIESSPLKLSWSTVNATHLMLMPDGINVTDKDSIILHPSRSKEYRLEASNELSAVSEIISVLVKPLPKLNYTMPDCSSILKIPPLNVDFSALTCNMTEINIDKWIMNPLTGRKRSLWDKLLEKVKNI